MVLYRNRFKNAGAVFAAFIVLAALIGLCPPRAFAAEPNKDNAAPAEPAVGDNGLFTQPWFLQSFLDLGEDLADAAKQGKTLVVLWEQRGCPYCREMHRVNLVRPEIRDYIKKYFVVLQLDLWGSRQVTDFDGKQMEERQLARRWRINGTPTLIFFPQDSAAVAGKPGDDSEVWRLVGYWKPFHFQMNFEYVHDQQYNKTPFQTYLRAKADELRKQGKEVKIW